MWYSHDFWSCASVLVTISLVQCVQYFEPYVSLLWFLPLIRVFILWKRTKLNYLNYLQHCVGRNVAHWKLFGWQILVQIELIEVGTTLTCWEEWNHTNFHGLFEYSHWDAVSYRHVYCLGRTKQGLIRGWKLMDLNRGVSHRLTHSF